MRFDQDIFHFKFTDLSVLAKSTGNQVAKYADSPNRKALESCFLVREWQMDRSTQRFGGNSSSRNIPRYLGVSPRRLRGSSPVFLPELPHNLYFIEDETDIDEAWGIRYIDYTTYEGHTANVSSAINFVDSILRRNSRK